MAIYSHITVTVTDAENESLQFQGGGFAVDSDVKILLLDSKGYETFKETFGSRAQIINPIETLSISKSEPLVTVNFTEDGEYAILWNHHEMFELLPHLIAE